MPVVAEIIKDNSNNGNIFLVKLKQENFLKNLKKNVLPLTNIYLNKINYESYYILKFGSNNGIKRSEIEFMKLAKSENLNKFIVEIIGDYMDIFDLNNKIVLEYSDISMQDFLFEKKTYQLLERHLKNKSEYKRFLVYLVHEFFQNIFNFLIKQEIVYLDWKFDNILLFYGKDDRNFPLVPTGR